MADHMVIASGRSTRQVASMAQKLAEEVKKHGHGSARLEDLPADHHHEVLDPRWSALASLLETETGQETPA